MEGHQITLLLDITATFVVILFFSMKKFNTWAESPPGGLFGNPVDFIGTTNFILYFCLYFLSVLVLAFAFFGIPGLTQIPIIEPIFTSLNIPSEEAAFTFFALLAVSILSFTPLEKYELEWRKKLHFFARIPRDVIELRDSLQSVNRFIPNEHYLKVAREEIVKAGNELSLGYKEVSDVWVSHLENYAQEKHLRTTHWHFLNCLLLLVVAKSVCPIRIIGPTQQAENRIRELGSLMLSMDIDDNHPFIAELDNLADFFEVCICKSIVVKYSEDAERFKALKNCGFNVKHKDCFKPKIVSSLSQCLLGVAFISVFSVAAVLLVLENAQTQPAADFFSSRFFTWSLGSFLSFAIAIIVGIVIAAQEKGKQRASAVSIFICISISTLAAALYFIIVKDLNARSEGNILARIVLALSFAMLSSIVYIAAKANAFYRQDIKHLALSNGLILAIILMIMQCAVSYFFNYKSQNYNTVGEFFYLQNHKMSFLAIIGFFKGLSLGVLVTYLIQNAKRTEYLKSLRSHPRASVEIPVTLSSESAPALALDLSKEGMMLEIKSTIKEGEQLSLNFMDCPGIKGLVKWTKKRSRGRMLVGIFLPEENAEVQDYLREECGAYYV